MMPDDLDRAMGWLARRELPGGLLLAVAPLTFGRARLCVDCDAAGYRAGY